MILFNMAFEKKWFIGTAFLLISFCSYAQKNASVFHVSIDNKEVHHQGINRLDINFTYFYSKNTHNAPEPDSFMIRKEIDSIILHYPNTTDWWEIVNKNLTSFFMNKYPDIDSLSSDILVHWTFGAGVDYGHRFPTRSVTARTRKEKLYEYFGFVTPMDSLFECYGSGKIIKIFIDLRYQYIQPIDNKDYPDGLAAENDFRKLICENYTSQKYWEDIIKETQKEMLVKYNKIWDLTSEIIFYDAGGEKFEARTITKR